MRPSRVCRGRESRYPGAPRLEGCRRLAGLACAALVLTPVSPAAAATARDSSFQPSLEATVRYLQDVQREDGGFAEAGHEPNADFTAWVTLALAAAGINPRDQTTAKQHWAGGRSAYAYLAEHAGEMSVTTDFARELLVVDAAGTSPHDFGGVDLVGEILKRQITDGNNEGAFAHESGEETPGVNDTIFAILALSPVHEPSAEHAVQMAVKWLAAQQRCDGSWDWAYTPRAGSCPEERRLLSGEEPGEVDMTGAALQALSVAGRTGLQAGEVEKKALEYVREAENPNGGFPVSVPKEGQKTEEPNVASTAWAVQAMWSLGINPETWATHSGLISDEALGFLASMQQPDGDIRWKASEEDNGMLMTAEVTPAFTGNPFPLPEVPYEPLPALPPEEPTSRDGGVSATSGSGVIAGGGGNGAPLFSRPQPGSKGHAPGGVRQLEDRRHDTTKHHRDPGPPHETRISTATAAGAHHPQRHDPASRKGTGGVALAGTGPGGGGQSSGQDVKGTLIGASSAALAPGAPGLRGAPSGEEESSWLAIGIAAAALALGLLGAFVELRRPQVVL